MTMRPLLYRPATILISSIVIALSFGFSFGNVGNQATYLPHALHRMSNDFLAYDWLVQETTVYHDRFSLIVSLMAMTGSIPWAAAVLNVAFICMGVLCIYSICTTVASKHVLPVFAVVVTAVMVEKTYSVAQTYLFSDGFQPSSIPTLAWLMAMVLTLRGHVALAGIALATGGYFHVNFLILGIATFGLMQPLMGSGWLKRGVLILTPSFAVLFFTLPLILSATTGDQIALGRDIFQRVRAPHHYLPDTYLIDFVRWGGWMLGGFGAALVLDDLVIRRRILALLTAFFVPCAIATILTTIVFIPQVAQLFVWRTAPFGIILSQICIANFVVLSVASGRITFPGRPSHHLALMGTGVVGLTYWYLHTFPLASQELLSMTLIAVATLVIFFCRRSENLKPNTAIALVGGTAALLAIAYLPPRLTSAYQKSTFIASNVDPLFAWARNTPKSSVFLIPPELGEFRLLAGRAVVVDWKSTPVLADELIVWHERINDIANRSVKDYEDAESGYRSQPLSELRTIAKKYGAQYVVLDRRKHVPKTPCTATFSSQRYLVFTASDIECRPAKMAQPEAAVSDAPT